jgi:hypothetical protein
MFEIENKMGSDNIAVVLAPALQMSVGILFGLLVNYDQIFGFPEK